jgi:chromate transporter
MSNQRISIRRLFFVFLQMGATCFGGPVAHLALFRRKFVEEVGWISGEEFAEWLALCQSLPGPSSSQMGIRIGRRLAGLPGALVAWMGFTLPGALALSALGLFLPHLTGWERAAHGLKVFTASVVAHAVWSMAKSLCPDLPRIGIAAAGFLVCWFLAGSAGQVAAIVLGGALGMWLPTRARLGQSTTVAGSIAEGWIFLGLFVASFALLEAMAGSTAGPTWRLADGLFRSGALVFGGGHVVLPLLRENVAIPMGIPDATFLWGYGLAQTMPGPLFNVAAFLGSVSGVAGGALFAVVCIFLPGALLLLGVLPFWDRLRKEAWFAAALPGVNAAVVGVLAATLAGPVREAGIRSVADLALAVVGFAVLVRTKIPVWILAVGMAAIGGLLLP